jgi:hypothetical protein
LQGEGLDVRHEAFRVGDFEEDANCVEGVCRSEVCYGRRGIAADVGLAGDDAAVADADVVVLLWLLGLLRLRLEWWRLLLGWSWLLGYRRRRRGRDLEMVDVFAGVLAKGLLEFLHACVHHALTIVCVDDSDGVGDVRCLWIVCMCVRNTNAVCRYGLFGCLLQGSCDLFLPLTIVTTERAADIVHYHVKVEPRFCLHVDYMLCRLAQAVHAFILQRYFF